ncbi:hypothetical protein [Absidia glauca]|uniref:BZIP domain-containing protein n=1 Tax=Absidia glauca TaxID=4829 RepID=A0A168LEW3_ABSGL|nr:hypothetical protein [Absidia glauca]
MSNDVSTSIDPFNIVSNPAHPGSKQTAKKRKLQAKKYMNDEAKRKNFLERNRQAALKCRQRKKQWLNDLQSKVDYLTNDNEQLQLQCSLMRDELIQLRRMLWTHKEVHSISTVALITSFNP